MNPIAIYFGSNLKVLRARKKRSQDEISTFLGITRAKLNSYENNVAKNPPLEDLLNFAEYYKISIDTLVKMDLGKLSEFQLHELEQGFDAYIRGSKLRVLATTVSSANRDNIELVPHKATAGYLAGYNDPEFISTLPVFNLPTLPKERKYRMFQITGDSMLPLPDKSYVIGEFVENWYDIKDKQPCVVVTKSDGITFKLVNNQLAARQSLQLVSLNTVYAPYEVAAGDIVEVWKFTGSLISKLPENYENTSDNLLVEMRNDIKELLNRK
jgi:transcriptional regulator with XRE-family HTH domain